MAPLPVLKSCHAVVQQSQFVRIHRATVSQFFHNNPRLEIPPLTMGPAPYHYFDSTAKTAEWIFVLDTLNHCFWPETNSCRWQFDYGKETLSGYWALAASLKGAMEKGIPLHRAETLATLDRATLSHIFQGRGKIPLFEERLQNLREAGRVLLGRFQGSFVHLLEESNCSATALVFLLAEEFPSFNDIADYHGATVCFFKRAQLLCHDLWCSFSGSSWGRFHDLDQLTAFADYKLPQVLRHLGFITYKPELAARIDNLTLIPPGSPEEVEIRAATVWVVDILRQELERHGHVVTPVQLDSWLWNLGQQDTYRRFPYHRTKTIFY
jgi:hypothetical protein